MLYSFIFGLILSTVALLGNRLHDLFSKYHDNLISFTGGIFLSYVFLELMENLSFASVTFGVPIFPLILLGFTAFHILNKIIYLHAGKKSERRKELMELHFLGFSLDSFFSGLAMALFIQTTTFFPAILALIPFMIHCFSLSFSFTDLHEKFKVSQILRILLSFLPLTGALSSFFLVGNTVLFYSSLAFVCGIVLYIATRHLIPSGTKGKLTWYLIGILLTIVLLLIA